MRRIAALSRSANEASGPEPSGPVYVVVRPSGQRTVRLPNLMKRRVMASRTACMLVTMAQFWRNGQRVFGPPGIPPGGPPQFTLRKITDALVPPNPKLFDRA